MKLFLAMSLLSGIGLYGMFAGASPFAKTTFSVNQKNFAIAVDNAGTCPYGYKEMPTYKWDKASHRWVFVGNTCYPSGGY